MNRGFGFILSVPILFIAILLMLLVHNVQQEQMQLEEYVLKFAIDYSTDAAVEEMLSMSHLGQDYADQGRTNADPEVALTTFINLMCMNYDLPLTEKSKMQIESGYIPVFCVAAYNGYYMYTPTEDSEGGWYLQGAQKIPYAYEVGDKYYALNTGGDSVHLLQDGHLTKETIQSQGISKDEIYRQINSIVSDALMYQFQETTGRSGEFIYIPSDLTTFKQVNPITGPTVISFIDGWDFKSGHAISAFSVGGAQLETARMVAVYEGINSDGTTTKLYAYADLLPEGTHIIDMFTSVEEAARNGYYYDPVYMG